MEKNCCGRGPVDMEFSEPGGELVSTSDGGVLKALDELMVGVLLCDS